MGIKFKLSKFIKSHPFFLTCYMLLGSAFFRFIGIFIKVKKNQILFSSMSGDLYGGSPKVLFDAISKKYGDSYKYIWALNDVDTEVDARVNKVKIDSLHYFIYALQSGIWITDVNIERGLLFKKKSNFYVNTWHGTAPKAGDKKRKDMKFNRINMLISDGQYLENVYQTYYGLTNMENVYRYGRPREDELYLANKTKQKFYKEKYNISGKKVVLYCPTWREKNISNPGEIFGLNVGLLSTKLGKDYVIVYHGHHLSNETNQKKFSDAIIDLSDVKNINELFIAADILITDYSSVMFDFLILNKPVICFAPDYNDFCSTRGLIFDLKSEMPYGVCSNINEVFNLIWNCDQLDLELYRKYFSKFINRPFNSTDLIIEELEKKGILKNVK